MAKENACPNVHGVSDGSRQHNLSENSMKLCATVAIHSSSNTTRVALRQNSAALAHVQRLCNFGRDITNLRPMVVAGAAKGENGMYGRQTNKRLLRSARITERVQSVRRTASQAVMPFPVSPRATKNQAAASSIGKREPLSRIATPRRAAPASRRRLHSLMCVSGPALPSALLTQIFDWAGLIEESGEFAYADDTLRQDLAREIRVHASPLQRPMNGWLEQQPEINPKMRTLVVDWIVEVYMNEGLNRRALLLAISIVDRYVSIRRVQRDNLQLIGACALMIGSKIDDTHPISSHQLIHYSADSYAHDEILSCECDILLALGFRIEMPTAAEFLPHLIATSQALQNLGPEAFDGASDPIALAWRYSAASAADLRRNALAWHFAETALLESDIVNGFLPSQVAAASLLLANRRHGHSQPWPPVLVDVCGHREEMLEACVSHLDELFQAADMPTCPFRSLAAKKELLCQPAFDRDQPCVLQTRWCSCRRCW